MKPRVSETGRRPTYLHACTYSREAHARTRTRVFTSVACARSIDSRLCVAHDGGPPPNASPGFWSQNQPCAAAVTRKISVGLPGGWWQDVLDMLAFAISAQKHPHPCVCWRPSGRPPCRRPTLALRPTRSLSPGMLLCGAVDPSSSSLASLFIFRLEVMEPGARRPPGSGVIGASARSESRSVSQSEHS